MMTNNEPGPCIELQNRLATLTRRPVRDRQPLGSGGALGIKQITHAWVTIVEDVRCAIQEFGDSEREAKMAVRAIWIRGFDRDSYTCRRHGRFHSPRAARMTVQPPSPPSAHSVQTKKKPPVDFAISG